MDVERLVPGPLKPASNAGDEGAPADQLAQVLSLFELAARLGVSSQTLYDLRSPGRGPRGFRVGRELRLRLCEVDAWLARLEGANAARHPAEPRRRAGAAPHRHDAIARNPVEGTTPALRAQAHPAGAHLEQIAAVRAAAARWRTGPGLPGPRPEGQVRDIIEVLLGSALRPGEVLAPGTCDIEEPRRR